MMIFFEFQELLNGRIDQFYSMDFCLWIFTKINMFLFVDMEIIVLIGKLLNKIVWIMYFYQS